VGRPILRSVSSRLITSKDEAEGGKKMSSVSEGGRVKNSRTAAVTANIQVMDTYPYNCTHMATVGVKALSSFVMFPLRDVFFLK